jgi:polar amino acid transport system substrate-binding protein
MLGWLICLGAAIFPGRTTAGDAWLVNFDAANPPFMYGSVQHAEGLYPALVDAAFTQMGKPVNLSAKPWKRALSELDLGIAGVGGIYKTEERLRKYDYSDPLFVERIAVYYHRDRPIIFSELPDLFGKRVGTLLGWSYGDDFDRARKAGKITVDEVPSDAQNFDKLARGRVDVVLAIEQVGTSFLRASGNTDILKSSIYLVEQSTHLAFLRKTDAARLLPDFNRALQDIRRNGVYGRILSQHNLAER